jgi:pimeloyl-ACP methyl ester carboxylesterase
MSWPVIWGKNKGWRVTHTTPSLERRSVPTAEVGGPSARLCRYFLAQQSIVRATLTAPLLCCARSAGPYVLVGHSLGCLTAQQFAYTYPWDVAGLVLFDNLLADLPAALPPSVHQQWADRLQGRPPGPVSDESVSAVEDCVEDCTARRVHAARPFRHRLLVVLTHGALALHVNASGCKRMGGPRWGTRFTATALWSDPATCARRAHRTHP